jgi:hypothetical protein
VYSNNDTLSVAIPYLWEKFDPEGYSFWYCEYKYPEELKRIFMSCNLVGGMFQRLDKLHKHAFASVIIFGEDNSSSISGVWLFRGQQLAFEVNINYIPQVLALNDTCLGSWMKTGKSIHRPMTGKSLIQVVKKIEN